MKIKITEKGLELLKIEIEDMRKRMIDVQAEKDLAYHTAGDTWHDNPTFVGLEQEEKRINTKIKEMEHQILNAEIITPESNKNEVIEVGSFVYCLSHNNGEPEPSYFEIVGYGESDIFVGRIRYDAPLSKAFLGAKRGDIVSFQAPRGRFEYQIIEIFQSQSEVDSHKRKIGFDDFK